MAAGSARAPLRQSELNGNHKYHFIDPLLVGRSPVDGNSREYEMLEREVAQYIAAERAQGSLKVASVYFRDLKNTLKFSIKHDEKFNPASLVKVPTMMAYLKASEAVPSILEDRLTYKGASNANVREHYRSSTEIAAGADYSSRDLIGRMIRNSDNNAFNLVFEHLVATKNYESFNGMLEDLGIPRLDGNQALGDLITAREFSMFFRVLYNSTYLSRQHSEAALDTLSGTDFSAGLVAGIPPGVVVSHKFGEFGLVDDAGVKRELHDCGIIYSPRLPYVLCVMTKGLEFPRLARVIAGISQRVYEYVQR